MFRASWGLLILTWGICLNLSTPKKKLAKPSLKWHADDCPLCSFHSTSEDCFEVESLNHRFTHSLQGWPPSVTNGIAAPKNSLVYGFFWGENPPCKWSYKLFHPTYNRFGGPTGRPCNISQSKSKTLIYPVILRILGFFGSFSC